ncbi:MAG: endonuclease domain-containing protein [Actinomycetota bacterium]
MEEALRRKSVSLPRLRWQLERCGGNGRRGSRSLRTLLNDRNRGYIPSESELELRFFRLLRRARIALPICQAVFKDDGRFIARVDFLYPERGLVIEVYGWRDHGARTRWEHDIARSTELSSRGHRVIAFTWNDVTKRPDEVVRAVARALAVTDPQGSFRLRRR